MITQKLGKNFLFHSNLDVNPKQINHFHNIIRIFSESGATTYRCRRISHIQ